MYDPGTDDIQDGGQPGEVAGEPLNQEGGEQATLEKLQARVAELADELELLQAENSAVHRENVRVAEECARHSRKLARIREYVEETSFTQDVKLAQILKILRDELPEPETAQAQA